MDKLAERLRLDAEAIKAPISEELDRRITASLQATEMETPEKPKSSPVRQRPALFWWASSLTGIAAAMAVIAVLNSMPGTVEPVRDDTPRLDNYSPVADLHSPIAEWKTEAAVLTAPLKDELEKLRSDIRKAEQQVKQDIGL